MKCKYCKSKNSKILKEAVDIRYTGDKFKLCICSDCGMTFTSPEISEEEMGRYYPSDYGAYTNKDDMRRVIDKILESPVSVSFLRNSVRKIMNLYSKTLYREINGSKINAFFNVILRAILDVTGKYGLYYNEPPLSGSNKSLLYIGSGNPEKFFRYKSEYNVDLYTIDINKEMCEIYNSKGIVSHNGTILSAKFDDKKFDVIYFTHVMEHLLNPKEELSLLSNWLSDEGVIVCGFPDHGSFEWNFGTTYYDVPRHQIHLNDGTAKMMFNDANLIVKKRIHLPYGWGLFQNQWLYNYLHSSTFNKLDFNVTDIPVKYKIFSYFLSLFNQSGHVIYYLMRNKKVGQ